MNDNFYSPPKSPVQDPVDSQTDRKLLALAKRSWTFPAVAYFLAFMIFKSGGSILLPEVFIGVSFLFGILGFAAFLAAMVKIRGASGIFHIHLWAGLFLNLPSLIGLILTVLILVRNFMWGV